MSQHVLSDEDAKTYLKTGCTPRELVRLWRPDATDAEADFILWERTPFPLVRGIHDIADAIADQAEEQPA